jgi:uncharacterized protein YjiS (DUF1127 family)
LRLTQRILGVLSKATLSDIGLSSSHRRAAKQET